jgi:hypothetical protein
MAKALPNRWVIGFTLASALVLVIAVVAYVIFWPKALRRNTALIAHVVEEAAQRYREENDTPLKGTRVEIVATLLGRNARQKSYLRPDFEEFLDDRGRVVDSWREPFRFDTGPEGELRLRSAGPNGLFEDEDDLTSDALR